MEPYNSVFKLDLSGDCLVPSRYWRWLLGWLL